MFIYLVRLSCILGDVLRALCSPRARLMSEKGLGLENISRNLEQMLLEWKISLPADLRFTEEELSRISRKELDSGLDWKLNNGGLYSIFIRRDVVGVHHFLFKFLPAGKLHLTYCAVYMLIKRPFISLGIGNASNVTMPAECRQAIKTSVDIFDVIDPSNLLCGWSLSSKFIIVGGIRKNRGFHVLEKRLICQIISKCRLLHIAKSDIIIPQLQEC